MATLTNTKIKDTYKSLLKVSDNGNLEAGLQEITDGEGNASGVQLNTSGDLTASGTVAFGSLKDSGENITITKLVDEADGIASNDNDTTIPTSAAVKDYVDTKVTAEDLDFAGDSGTGAVDLDSQILTIEGTANEVVTSASGQTLTIGLPSTINVDVQGALTGNVTGNVSGNVTGNVTGNVSGDLTGNVTATSVLANGVVATTQASSDNSTKVATTAFVKSVVTAEDLDFGGDSGTGSVDLDSQTLTIAGTANEIVTSAAGQTLTVGLPSSITVDVVGNLTGNVSGNVTGDVTGNADTATALETSRTIALSGDVVASGSFDGSANLTLSATIQPNSVALGTDTTGDYVSNLGAGTGVTIASNTGEGSNPTITVNYGSTANTSVEGDTALTIQGTTNEIEVSGGAVTLGSGGTVTVGLPDNVIIAGDLTVNGTTTTVNTQTLSVKDPLIELANQNLSNSVDTGFFADYSLDAGVTIKYSGLFKDASDSDKFKLFKGLEVEPATTVDVLGTGYTKGDLVVNDLDAVTISGTLTGNVSGNLTGNVTGDLTGNVTATSVLANGVIATTQTIGDNSTKVATTAYVDAAITAEDLDIAGDSGTGSVDLDSQTLTIAGTANEIETSASGQTITIGLPSTITANVTGNVAGDLTGTVLTAAQTNITSVGTLSSLTVAGALNGTISTASQPNITSVGTLSSLAVSGNLTVDTNTLFVDAANNFVGIGTTSPSTQLNVLKDSANVEILASSTTSGNVRLGMDASGATYNWIQTERSSSAMQFAIGNAERMRIDSSGRVGIGTASIDSGFILETAGNIKAGTNLSLGNSGGDYDGVGYNIGFTGTGDNWNYLISDTASLLEFNSGGFIFSGAGAGTAGNPITLAERMRINSIGNVGIGASDITTVGTYKILELNGSASSGGYLRLASSDVEQGYIATNSSGLLIVSNGATHQSFYTNNAERLRIDASGNVGIGVSPSAKLHTSSAATGNAVGALLANSNTSGAADSASLNFGLARNDAFLFNIPAIKFLKEQTWTGTGSTIDGSLVISTIANESVIEAARFNSGGNMVFPNGQGIDFSASAGGGATSSLLDDYEEGTWTPVITDGTNNATMNATYNRGQYIKVGALVTLSAYVVTDSLGSVTGTINISGLPFTNGSGFGFLVGGVAGTGGGLNLTAGENVTCTISTGGNFIILNVWNAATGSSQMDASEWSAGGQIQMGITYLTS